MNRIERSPLTDRHALRTRDRTPLATVRFLAAWVRREAMTLDPACFALVMATGIVSNAFFVQGYRLPSDVLLAINLVAYPWLCLLTTWRALRSRQSLMHDLTSPFAAFSFFTFVAACDVLGLALALRGFTSLALVLWLVAIASWAALIYLAFGVLMFRNSAKEADVAAGGWLNAIVATQSLVILGARAALPAACESTALAMMIYALWTIGLGLYGIYATLFCQRLLFHELKPADVGPLLWVVMGAAAISANAGATLAAGAGHPAFFQAMQPFVDGLTLAMWAWATWWIPLLLLLGLWKHRIRRVPIVYAPVMWSIVFPLGMYAVTSWRLAGLVDLPALASWSAVMGCIALAAWCATAAGLALASLRSLRSVARLAAAEDSAAKR